MEVDFLFAKIGSLTAWLFQSVSSSEGKEVGERQTYATRNRGSSFYRSLTAVANGKDTETREQS